ncbi:unnamed protein product [Adineta ricciae]|uniref:F-box domain-containing protein n=1 Tax=Adineta ricciae TaxID=249248 RepID=A0A814CW86_ADIRI|nr:unnamed protein product [Adineta ricciae]CAF1117217.1 unnamed protein product [Adineta ricciae]
MSSTQPVTVLESLPDEVLLVILSYLHAIDRLRTFKKLNSRFDRCLREVGVGIDDELASDEPLVRKFALRTIFIRCNERNEELDLSQFPALRSLTLADGVWPQVVTINPEEMPVIQHISLRSKSVFNIEEAHTELFEDVLSNKYPWLISIHLSHGIFHLNRELLDAFNPCDRIHSATIGFCHVTLFELLLCYLPNVSMLDVRVDDWHLANRIRNVKAMPDHWQQTSLCFLTLHLDHPFKKRHFEWLVNRLPVLIHLDVDSRHDENNPHRLWTYNTELMETFSEVTRTQNAND